MRPYPMLLRPILKEKVWGGTRLARWNKKIAPGARVGESWELVDLHETSPSGGGGGEARSVIENGTMRGRTLEDAIGEMGADLMGAVSPDPQTGGFPLMIKYLDAREDLSVQAHPSPAYAAAHRGARLKSESWYVLDADPGAMIYSGLRARASRAELAARARSGAIVSDLAVAPAVPGDVHHLPSGVCHALGAGTVIFEVQTSSDTTFRLYDWGREGRELHVEQAAECVADSPLTGPPPRRADGPGRAPLDETDHFTIAQRRLAPGARDDLLPERGAAAPLIWACVRGEGRLASGAGDFDPIRFRAGDTFVLPAAMRAATVETDADTTILEVGTA